MAIGIGSSVVVPCDYLHTWCWESINTGLNSLDRIGMATGVQIWFDTFKGTSRGPDLFPRLVSHTQTFHKVPSPVSEAVCYHTLEGPACARSLEVSKSHESYCHMNRLPVCTACDDDGMIQVVVACTEVSVDAELSRIAGDGPDSWLP